MIVADHTTPSALKRLFDKIDDAGYYSVLMTYHSSQTDLWAKSINLINPSYKFKFQPAIRTYAISPEYFAMMYNACEQISKNKYMFNIVAGNLWNNTEKTLDNIVYIKDIIDTPEKRLDYTAEWMHKLKSSKMISNFPEIVMSGYTDKTLENASMYADYTMPMIPEFKEDPKRFMVTKKGAVVCGAFVIRDSFEEAEKVVEAANPAHQKTWTFYGTENDILNSLKELKDLGATGFMIRQLNNDQEIYRIHDFVKKYKDFDWEKL
jgi:alkanesulfonate monooxygenase SsuD/methylene tetrahydromethanopterin reductase-like flavin-dependent oxidoreductase (luciferase family)